MHAALGSVEGEEGAGSQSELGNADGSKYGRSGSQVEMDGRRTSGVMEGTTERGSSVCNDGSSFSTDEDSSFPSGGAGRSQSVLTPPDSSSSMRRARVLMCATARTRIASLNSSALPPSPVQASIGTSSRSSASVAFVFSRRVLSICECRCLRAVWRDAHERRGRLGEESGEGEGESDEDGVVAGRVRLVSR
jgi:hypothetical protein